MSKLPRPAGRDLVAALGKLGFEVVRTRGSHHYLRHADGRATVVPVHPGETVGPGLMAKILRDRFTLITQSPDENSQNIQSS